MLIDLGPNCKEPPQRGGSFCLGGTLASNVRHAVAHCLRAELLERPLALETQSLIFEGALLRGKLLSSLCFCVAGFDLEEGDDIFAVLFAGDADEAHLVAGQEVARAQ